MAKCKPKVSVIYMEALGPAGDLIYIRENFPSPVGWKLIIA